MAYKIYAAVLNQRLKKDVEEENILPKTQFGFSKNRNIIDNMYVIEIEKAKHRDNIVYSHFSLI